MTEKTNTVRWSPTTKGKDYWLSRDYISTSTRKLIQDADIVLVPFEGFREHLGPVFPQGTTEFFRFIRDQSNGEFDADICIDDDEYIELALHGETVVIATFVVTNVFLPLAISLLANFLTSKLKSRKAEATVKVCFIVEDDTGVQELQYEGPASELEHGIEVKISSGHTEKEIDDGPQVN